MSWQDLSRARKTEELSTKKVKEKEKHAYKEMRSQRKGRTFEKHTLTLVAVHFFCPLSYIKYMTQSLINFMIFFR